MRISCRNIVVVEIREKPLKAWDKKCFQGLFLEKFQSRSGSGYSIPKQSTDTLCII